MTPLVQVWIVDDRPAFRRAAAAMVAASAGFVLAGVADSGEAALELTRGAGAGLVLMDIHMPGMGLAGRRHRRGVRLGADAIGARQERPRGHHRRGHRQGGQADLRSGRCARRVLHGQSALPRGVDRGAELGRQPDQHRPTPRPSTSPHSWASLSPTSASSSASTATSTRPPRPDPPIWASNWART
nr:response regulator [Nocardia tengchongensis]